MITYWFSNKHTGKMAFIACAFTVVISTAQAEDGADLVKDLRGVFGEHHARAVHAKGIILEGNFVPAKEAALLSKAGVFAQGTVPVTVTVFGFHGNTDNSRQRRRGQSTWYGDQVLARRRRPA